MKRSPLHRKTPLKRTGRLRRVSKKRAKQIRMEKPIRDALLRVNPICQWCNSEESVDPHEISRGYARQLATGDPDLILCVCRNCHDSLDDNLENPPELQIARKLCIIIAKYNRNRARANAVTLRDVFERLDFVIDQTQGE